MCLFEWTLLPSVQWFRTVITFPQQTFIDNLYLMRSIQHGFRQPPIQLNQAELFGLGTIHQP
jgi:hypothetical protein